ncbi:MAG: Fur family transcriptional regulator [Acidimicrobiales bacterium]
MNPPPASLRTRRQTDELHAVVTSHLRSVGLRYTPGRRAVVELLARSGHPVSIGDVERALPALPRSSAYRHLADLQTATVVHRIAATDDFARYELAEDLTEHHHHLLCTDCGSVIDIASTAAFERMAAEHLDRLAEAEGFVPTSHRIDVFGRCAACTSYAGAR